MSWPQTHASSSHAAAVLIAVVRSSIVSTSSSSEYSKPESGSCTVSADLICFQPRSASITHPSGLRSGQRGSDGIWQ